MRMLSIFREICRSKPTMALASLLGNHAVCATFADIGPSSSGLQVLESRSWVVRTRYLEVRATMRSGLSQNDECLACAREAIRRLLTCARMSTAPGQGSVATRTAQERDANSRRIDLRHD